MKYLVPCLALIACGDDAADSDSGDSATDSTVMTDTLESDTGDDDTSVADTSDADTHVEPAPWYDNAVFYEVFVRSFQDSDGDGKGDLAGLVSRLDYLNDGVPGGDDLEVDGLWLMPIFQSDSYHGYDTTDYRSIESDYGTSADFDALIAACEARGIKVVLDFVMNHTGSGHAWFQAAKSSPSDARRNWYVWRDDDPGWTQPFGSDHVWHALGGHYFYGIFWSGMPDLNYREPAVVTEMTDIARSWLDRGAAGFRLDAARYLVESASGGLYEQPETHAFWKQLRVDLASRAPYLVGEVWTGRNAVATYWGGGAELTQAFDFDLQVGITKAAQNHEARWVRDQLTAQKTSGAPWGYSASFLSNHDLDCNAVRLDDGAQRAAAFVLMTMPGTPYLYYGDELGMKSSPVLGDEAKRGPMAWSTAANAGFSTATPWVKPGPEADVRNVTSALADPNSLIRLYQSLVRARHAHPALAGPEIAAVAQPDAWLLVTLRYTKDAVYLVAVNLDDATHAAIAVDLSAQSDILGAGPWDMTIIFGHDAPRQVTDPSAVPMGEAWTPHEGRIWKLR